MFANGASMTSLKPRSLVRPLPILAALLTGAVITLGCSSETPGQSPFGDSGGGGTDPGAGGSTGSSNPTTGSGSGSGAGAGSGAGSGAGATSSSSGGVQQASFTVALQAAAIDIDLDTSLDVNVTVKPNGYKGAVTLDVTGLGAGVTGKLGTTTLNLDGATNATTKLTLTSGISTAPGDMPFTVSASAMVANGTKTTNGTLTVHSAITITIPQGVDGMEGTQASPNTQAFGPYPMKITAPANLSAASPVTVRFYNADGKSHQIHAGANAQGFPHDPAPIAPNSMDGLVRNVNAKGTYDYYLHDEGSPLNVGRIIIQ